MKSVVITGSARGFGLAMAKFFKASDLNVVLCDVSKENLKKAREEIEKIKSDSDVIDIVCDVTKEEDINKLIKKVKAKFKTIDIWINNAGVNQPNKAIWELTSEEISKMIDIDLKGTILCSSLIVNFMKKQGHGAIYNVEGYGSNDAKMLGLSIYGTAKRAVTYFTESLAKEIKIKESNILVGKITPGIMITDFLTKSLGDKGKIELDEETKNIYNILGDYPEVIAEFMVDKILKNGKNNVKFTWLTNYRATKKFISSIFYKRNLFEDDKN